jgi:hypothetical protein
MKKKTLDARIKFGANLFHLTGEKKRKSKTGHRFYEEKKEFGSFRSEFFYFKWGGPTILGPTK